jgi:para-nitrobenzyl esterase
MKIHQLMLATLVVGLSNHIGSVQADAPKLLTDPIATDAGYVAGTTIGTLEDAARVYRGIPYAAPPIGKLRWKAPQPVTPWTGILETTQFTKMAIQSSDVVQQLLGGLAQSEDCLHLHVVTPARSKREKLPVMVWFHGGGFTIGSASDALFNSYRLASNGVVTVSVNHRLGVMGLFAHPELTAEAGTSGNYMVLDMIAALKWVQRNIEAFGGDPDNVTIFGQSGGGGKVSALIASPLAAGLFDKAIIQSGAPFPGSGLPRADLEANGTKLLEGLGVTSLEQARALDPQKIVAKDNELLAAKTYPGWATAIDGQVLEGAPLDVIAAGKGNPVTLIAGGNAGELGQFNGMLATYAQMFNGILSTGKSAYAYIFDQVPANWRALGGVSVHSMELFYVFGDYDGTISPANWQLAQMVEGRTNPTVGATPVVLTEADRAVSINVMAMWSNFAKTGRPTLPIVPTLQRRVVWPQWNPSDDGYLFIADSLKAMSGFSTVAPAADAPTGPTLPPP